MLKSKDISKDDFFIESFKSYFKNALNSIDKRIISDKSFEERILSQIIVKLIKMMLRILSLNSVKNTEKYLLDISKTYLESFIQEIDLFIQNNIKDLNKPLVEINFLKIKILYQLICLVLKEKLDIYSIINYHKNEIYRDFESLRIKESFLYENSKCTESFFRDIVFSLPNICKISEFLHQLFNEFEMDSSIINDLNSKCLPNTIKIRDEDSITFSNSSNFLKKKKYQNVNTPDEKIYNYFKIVNKSSDSSSLIPFQSSDKKYSLSEKKSSPSNEKIQDSTITINKSNSFAILGDSNNINFNNIVDYKSMRKPLMTSNRKYYDNCYFPEVPENSNFSFADRDISRKIVVLGNGFNNFSSSSKKSTNYSIISFPTVKEFSFVQEANNSNLEQILNDNNNSMRSNRHNDHRGINRRLPELQYLPRTKKKQLSGKKKKTKGQSSILYQYFENLNKSNSEKSGSEDNNSINNNNKGGINNSFYGRKQNFEKEDNFGEENRSSRKKNIPIKNFNSKDHKTMKNSTNYLHQIRGPSIKSSIFNKDLSPRTEKSEEEIIAFSTPDRAKNKFYNPKPKICVNLFNNHY